jgi:predicted hotdog family 3-hydroxylacyl-ACP dehydratase
MTTATVLRMQDANSGAIPGLLACSRSLQLTTQPFAAITLLFHTSSAAFRAMHRAAAIAAGHPGNRQ